MPKALLKQKRYTPEFRQNERALVERENTVGAIERVGNRNFPYIVSLRNWRNLASLEMLKQVREDDLLKIVLARKSDIQLSGRYQKQFFYFELRKADNDENIYGEMVIRRWNPGQEYVIYKLIIDGETIIDLENDGYH